MTQFSRFCFLLSSFHLIVFWVSSAVQFTYRSKRKVRNDIKVILWFESMHIAICLCRSIYSSKKQIYWNFPPKKQDKKPACHVYIGYVKKICNRNMGDCHQQATQWRVLHEDTGRRSQDQTGNSVIANSYHLRHYCPSVQGLNPHSLRNDSLVEAWTLVKFETIGTDFTLIL